MNARIRVAAACGALALAAGTAAQAAPPPPTQAGLPALALVPAHVGGSISFHYDANESAPGGPGATHAVVTLTRVVNDRVAITLTPDEGPPAAAVARIENGGALRLESGSRFARGEAAANDGPRTDGDVPLDRPIGGLPGQTGSAPGGYGGSGQSTGGYGGRGQGTGGYGGRGQGTGGYGQRGQSAGTFDRPAQRSAVPNGIVVVAALVAGRSQAPASARGWSFSTPAGNAFVPMTARVESLRSGVASVVADGSGEIQVASGEVAIPQPQQSPAGGYGGYGGRRRGGNGQGGYGGTGQGGYGGTGQGGYGGTGQGGYGGNGQGGYGGYDPQSSTVPATVEYHVESTFRGGRLMLARGSETTTPHGGAAQSPTTVRWTLTPL
jgi:hypothetical protein